MARLAMNSAVSCRSWKCEDRYYSRAFFRASIGCRPGPLQLLHLRRRVVAELCPWPDDRALGLSVSVASVRCAGIAARCV